MISPGSPLKVVTVFNRYLQRGGEEQVFEDEAALLSSRGCDVAAVAEPMGEPEGLLERARMARDAVWSPASYRRFLDLLEAERPHVLHLHNFFPLISPSIYHACRRRNVPVVHTLHNYRFLCAGNNLYRRGAVCEKCLGKIVPWHGLRHRCYQGSAPRTAVVAAMLGVHNLLGTWRRNVDVFIALTGFSRAKFAAGGLPAEKLFVKPNFVAPDPGPGRGRGGYALFAGRLAEEKGVRCLLKAWERGAPPLPLKIAGDGPLRDEVAAQAARLPGVEYVGPQPRSRVQRLMSDAVFLVCPSELYEGALPLTILESFAAGTPVVASNLGAMSGAIEPGRTGWLFRAGDPGDLADRARKAAAEAPGLRAAARQEFETKYTAEKNFALLLDAYRRALARRNRPLPAMLRSPHPAAA